MSISLNLPFLVAKFTIEGAREGADNSAPPRLSSARTAPVLMPKTQFPINPFSLSRSSFSNSHVPVAQNSLNVPNSVPPSASVSFLSRSSHAHSLFSNPFLPKHISDSSLTSSSIKNHPTHSTKLPFSQTAVQSTHGHLQCLNTLLVSELGPPAATSSSTPAQKPRKPRSDRLMISSPFRPRVSAVDRIFSWRTPYGLSHDESLLAQLPPALVDSAKMSIMGSLAISSRSTYAAGLLRFHQFCDKWQISEGARMPASYALLCAFIGNYKGTISGKTIKSWLSGIRAWHLTNHAPWYGDDKWVQMARISANKEGSRHKRPLRAPVSIEHLLVLRKAITLSNYFHAAVWVVALVTFFGCRRLGETTVSSVSSFDSNLHVLRSAMYVPLHISSFFLRFYLPSFLVSHSTTYEMARVLRPSASLGLKPLAKKELLSSSPRAAISSALVPPYATTSLSTPMSQIPPHYLPISPTTDAGST